jgi:hypothetical protein
MGSPRKVGNRSGARKAAATSAAGRWSQRVLRTSHALDLEAESVHIARSKTDRAFASAQVELTHDWDPKTYSRDDISFELLQQGRAPPRSLRTSMPNVGKWKRRLPP